MVVIDDTVVVSNEAWGATATATHELTEGSHTVELRVGNGSGGAGPGWDQKGLALAKSDTAGSTDSADYLSFVKSNIDMESLGSTYGYNAILDGITLNGNSSIEVLGTSTPVIKTDTLDAAGDTSGAGQHSLDLNGADLIVGTGASASSFNGRIVDGGTLIKAETNSLAIAGSNQDLDALRVDAGTLQFDGSFTSNITITVKGDTVAAGEVAPGTLQGVGTVGDVVVESGAFLAPGNSIGTLTAEGDVDVLGTMNVELNGDSGQSDLLNVDGVLDISAGAVDFSVLNTLDDESYVFASYGSLNGSSFASVENRPDGYTIDYSYNDSNQVALVIPEPSILSMIGLIALLMYLKRRVV